MHIIAFLFVLLLGGINCLLLAQYMTPVIVACHKNSFDIGNLFYCMSTAFGAFFANSYFWPLALLFLALPFRKKLKNHHIYMIGIAGIITNLISLAPPSSELKPQSSLESSQTLEKQNSNSKEKTATEKTSSSNLTYIQENHAEITENNVVYVLETYIVLFEQPYYITIQRKDNKPINFQTAEKLAIEYILPRGCTSDIKRLPSLDRQNSNQSKILIGLAC